MFSRSDLRGAAGFRIACLLLVLCWLLNLSACSGSDGKAPSTEAVTETFAKATPDSATPDVATPDSATETIAPTQAPTAYSFRGESSNPDDPYDATGFVSVSDVIPDVILDIRYYNGNNFVGDRIDGYEEPLALLSEEAARALKNAADDLRQKGYRLKLFDAYRPKRAVEHFASWANDWSDTRNQEAFYPNLDKSVLFDYGYIAYYSGHSRGSKVDLTLTDASGEELDMGGSFDFFDSLSHPDYSGVTEQQYANRMLLREAMFNNGFEPCDTEWWDFTLSNEPYPYTYFDFPVSKKSLTY